VWFRFEDCLNIDRPRYIHDSNFVFGDGVLPVRSIDLVDDYM
jgi:hypothetical protein